MRKNKRYCPYCLSSVELLPTGAYLCNHCYSVLENKSATLSLDEMLEEKKNKENALNENNSLNKYQKAYQNLTNRIYKNDHIEDVYKDLEVLGELVDKATPKRPIGKHTDYKCPVCGTRVRSGKGSSS